MVVAEGTSTVVGPCDTDLQGIADDALSMREGAKTMRSVWRRCTDCHERSSAAVAAAARAYSTKQAIARRDVGGRRGPRRHAAVRLATYPALRRTTSAGLRLLLRLCPLRLLLFVVDDDYWSPSLLAVDFAWRMTPPPYHPPQGTLPAGRKDRTAAESTTEWARKTTTQPQQHGGRGRRPWREANCLVQRALEWLGRKMSLRPLEQGTMRTTAASVLLPLWYCDCCVRQLRTTSAMHAPRRYSRLLGAGSAHHATPSAYRDRCFHTFPQTRASVRPSYRLGPPGSACRTPNQAPARLSAAPPKAAIKSLRQGRRRESFE